MPRPGPPSRSHTLTFNVESTEESSFLIGGMSAMSFTALAVFGSTFFNAACQCRSCTAHDRAQVSDGSSQPHPGWHRRPVWSALPTARNIFPSSSNQRLRRGDWKGLKAVAGVHARHKGRQPGRHATDNPTREARAQSISACLHFDMVVVRWEAVWSGLKCEDEVEVWGRFEIAVFVI